MTLIDKALFKVYAVDSPAQQAEGSSNHEFRPDGSKTLHDLDAKKAGGEPHRELYLHPPASPITGTHQADLPLPADPHDAAASEVAETLDCDGETAEVSDEADRAAPSARNDEARPPFRLVPPKQRIPKRLVRLLSYEVSTDDVDECIWDENDSGEHGQESASTTERPAIDTVARIDPSHEMHEPEVARLSEPEESARATPDERSARTAAEATSVREVQSELEVEPSTDDAASLAQRMLIGTETEEQNDPADDFDEDVAERNAAIVEAVETAQPNCQVNAQFKAAWEVDEFRLPEVCEQAETVLQEKMQLAAQEIVDDCRPSQPVICVNSWSRGEGRTTVALLVARALAKAGVRVALVDADVDNPQLAKCLGIALDPETTLGEASVEGIVERSVHSVADRLTAVVIPDSVVPSSGAHQTIAEQIAILSQHFQIVIVDHGPGSDVLPDEVIGCRIVVNACSEPGHPSADWAQRLERTGTVPVKVVENFAYDQVAE